MAAELFTQTSFISWLHHVYVKIRPAQKTGMKPPSYGNSGKISSWKGILDFLKCLKIPMHREIALIMYMLQMELGYSMWCKFGIVWSRGSQNAAQTLWHMSYFYFSKCSQIHVQFRGSFTPPHTPHKCFPKAINLSLHIPPCARLVGSIVSGR